jgi:hypothetical protein
MAQLRIVWRNSNLMRQVRPRRLQRYAFGSIVYSVQELVSPGQPEIWISISTFEVLLQRSEIRVPDNRRHRASLEEMPMTHHSTHGTLAINFAPLHND